VINRARRLGYCSPDTPTFNDLCDNADDELFNKAMLWSNHVLHALLPPTSASSQRYNLRQRPHLLQLPEHTTQLSECSFLIRMLYKDTYRLSFLPRCIKCRRGLAMRILSVCPSVRLSVCPSVCLSVRRVIPDKMEERSVQIFIPYERTFSLVF